MNLEFVSTIALPIALIIIMFGLGLSLVVDDFRRILSFPKPVIVGLFCQLFILPPIAFALCYAFSLPSAFAIGLVLLAASPGGVTSNIYSHLSKGDVALNLTLTAINSVLAAFTLPLITGLAIAVFAEAGQEIGFQFGKMLQVFFVILVPVSIGMFVRYKSESFASAADRPVRIFSLLVLVVIILTAIGTEWKLLVDNINQVGWAVLVFNLVSMGVGYMAPILLKISHAQATAISFEVGIHNGTVALYVAMSVLGSTEVAVPPAIYSILMFFTAGALAVYFKKMANNVS